MNEIPVKLFLFDLDRGELCHGRWNPFVCLLKDEVKAATVDDAYESLMPRAVKKAREKGLAAGLLKLITLFPFPEGPVKQCALNADMIIVPELNRGQIAWGVERVVQGDCPVERLRRVDGAMMMPDQIYQAIVQGSGVSTW